MSHFARAKGGPGNCLGTSLVVWWLRILLAMQGIQVQSLIQEDRTGHRAMKDPPKQGGFHTPQLKPCTAKEVTLLLSLCSRSLRLQGLQCDFTHCPTICDPMDCSTPGFPVLHHLPEFAKLMSIESMVPSNHLILCCPLLLLLSIFLSIRVLPMSWLFASCGKNIRPSPSVLLMNI